MSKQDPKIDVKLGSEEMIFWRNLVDARKQDLKITEDNLKFYKWLVENGEKEYHKAEKAFNEKV